MVLSENNLIIHSLRVLTDNIIWIWVSGKNAVVIDPSISDPVKDWLRTRDLNLIAILQTHHHSDHIGGTVDLLNQWPNAQVIAAKEDLERIPFQTISVSKSSTISVMNHNLQILELPGHTNHHIAFFIPSNEKLTRNPVLFCGDVLFGGGCGRIFDGTHEEMFNSLQLIKRLPSHTQIYCAHEYTESNLIWANHLRPKNRFITQRLKEVKDIRKEGGCSLPSILDKEKRTNLFLQAKGIKEFLSLRHHKDNWKG